MMATVRRWWIRGILTCIALLFLLVLGLSIWLWYWQPTSSSPAIDNTVEMTLPQAIRNTTVMKTYPRPAGMSVRFVKPTEPPRLPSRAIISVDYKSLHGHWYSGPVQVFYADVIGLPGVSSGHGVWVVENHMLFPHSEPWMPAWKLHKQQWVHKWRLLVGIAKPMTATSYQIFDGSTGKSLGEIRSESGGF